MIDNVKLQISNQNTNPRDMSANNDTRRRSSRKRESMSVFLTEEVKAEPEQQPGGQQVRTSFYSVLLQFSDILLRVLLPRSDPSLLKRRSASSTGKR